MDKGLIFLIVIANLVGFAYGIYYYSDQLKEWSPLFWILITDCPLQALFVGLIFLFFISISIKNNKNNSFFEFFVKFTSVGAIKYGMWTMFVIVFHSNYFLTDNYLMTYSILFIAHFGLLAEGLVLAEAYKFSKRDIALIAILYLINDYSDYVIGTHPIIPLENIEFIAKVTVAMTFVSLIIAKFWESNKIIKTGIISRFLSS